MRISVLGVMSVSGVTGPVPTGAVARRVIAILAAEANHAVSAERLADLVWLVSTPRSGNSLQAHVSRWRKVLGAHRITFTPGGYTLVAAREEVDALEFETAALEAAGHRGRGNLATAVETYDRALALWRGPAFADLVAEDCVRARREKLELLRERMRLDRLEVLGQLGAHELVISDATELSVADPWNEPLHRVLAVAHCGTGDQVAALKVLSDLRIRLHHDLGLDLSPQLQELQGQILRQEPLAGLGARSRDHTTESRLELVGREHELGVLSALFDRASRGSGGAVALISGEPGIGKTSLAERLDQMVGRESAASVVWAHSHAEPATAPGGLWSPVLLALGQPGVLDGDDVGGAELAEQVVAAVAERPALVLLDDLDSADPVSVEVLDQLSRRLDRIPLMIVALYRTLHGDNDHLAATVTGMVRRRGVHSLNLAGLDHAAIAELIARRSAVVPDWLVDRLAQSSGGNPYYVVETIDALASQGPISALSPEHPWPLSAGVRDQMRWRLGLLPDGTVRALQMAALAGPELDTGQLARSLGLAGPELAKVLEPALSSRFLIRTETGIGFGHSLGRDAIAALVDAAEALRMHRRLGDALTGRPADATVLLRRANHLAAAAPLDRAIAAQSIALDRDIATTALRQGRYADAERHLRRALLSADHADDAGTEVVAGLHLCLAEALQRRGDLEQAMSVYRRSAELADAAGDAITLVRSALGHEECSLHARRHRFGAADASQLLLDRALAVVSDDDPVRARLLAARGQALAFSGLKDQASEVGRAALATARSTGDRELVARTLLCRIPQLQSIADLPERIATAGEAADLASTAQAEELALDAWCLLVPDLMRAGQIQECHSLIDRIERLIEAYDNHLHRWKVPMWRAALALAAGRHAETALLIEDFRVIGERYRYRDTMRVYSFQSLLLAVDTGSVDVAQSILTAVDHDVSFEPWAAARLMVAHASGDEELTRAYMLPLIARRFKMSRPYASIQTFSGCLIAEAVAASTDRAAMRLLIEVMESAVGQNQVLGAGAAMLGDPALHLAHLMEGVGDRTRAIDLFVIAENSNRSWGLSAAADRSRSRLEQMMESPA